MRSEGSKLWLINTFDGHQCDCGEAETVTLQWYPNHKKIYQLVIRYGKNTSQRNEAIKLIESSKAVCSNCVARIEHGLASFII
jgi:hypothetical protein